MNKKEQKAYDTLKANYNKVIKLSREKSEEIADLSASLAIAEADLIGGDERIKELEWINKKNKVKSDGLASENKGLLSAIRAFRGKGND